MDYLKKFDLTWNHVSVFWFMVEHCCIKPTHSNTW